MTTARNKYTNMSHEEKALAIGQFVFTKSESLARSVAKEVKAAGLVHYSKADAEALKTWLMETRKLKAAAARKAISRVRAELERIGVKVERDKRGGKRSAQPPKGPDEIQKPDPGATADELDAARKKKAKRAVTYVNGVLEYIAFLPGTWSTKSEETQLVKMLERVRKMAKADQE